MLDIIPVRKYNLHDESTRKVIDMKKAFRIILPIILAIVIIICTAWYLFVYDRAFTRDMLLSCARYSESQGNHNVAAWFYNIAYAQSGNSDEVAIELAQQYKSSGNYTKAEYTLSNAISDGGGVDLYIALCKTYVEQDKLLDAVTMLDSVSNPAVKEQLASMRPSTPSVAPQPGFYSQFISVSLSCENGVIYYSPSGEYPSISSAPYTDPIALTEGENTIYALSIAENGLVSPLSIYGYTVGGVVQKVTFADPTIESSIRTLLNAGEDTELYTNDLWTIKNYEIPANAKDYSDLKHMAFLEQLTVSNGKSNDFSFLSSLPNLVELSIKNTDISQENLKIISGLPQLKKLTLSYCNISGVTPLSKATSLVYLDLNNNTIRNIDGLDALVNLQELNLQHNAVQQLNALSSLNQLQRLDVSYNVLTSVAPLSKLSSLTWLDASVNKITELGQIGNLKKLTHLSLAGNNLTNVSALSACTTLEELNISSNAIADISALAALTNMLDFDFSYNQVKNLPAFSKNCQLVTINGSNNKISSLSNLGGLEHLNIVNMDYNADISSVKVLSNCPVLVEVNVYGTKVKDGQALSDNGIIVNYKPV